MNLLGQYMQYSKLFTTAFGVAYLLQVASVTVLICLYPDAQDALLELVKTTTGLFGIVFGCYTGNSTMEKYINKKALTAAAMGGTAQAKQNEG